MFSFDVQRLVRPRYVPGIMYRCTGTKIQNTTWLHMQYQNTWLQLYAPCRSDHLWMFSFDVQRLVRPHPFPALRPVDGQLLLIVAIGMNLREHIRERGTKIRNTTLWWLVNCKHGDGLFSYLVCVRTDSCECSVHTYLDSVHWLSIVAMQKMEPDRIPLAVKEQALSRKAAAWSSAGRGLIDMIPLCCPARVRNTRLMQTLDFFGSIRNGAQYRPYNNRFPAYRP